MSHLSKPHSNRAPATLLHVDRLHGVLGKTAAYWWNCHWPWCLCSRENGILIILDVIRFSSLDFVNWVEGETLYLCLSPVSFYEVQADLSFIQQNWRRPHRADSSDDLWKICTCFTAVLERQSSVLGAAKLQVTFQEPYSYFKSVLI